MRKTKKMKLQRDHPPEVERATPPPSDMELQLEDIMDLVFGNHLLRDKILEHVIYPSDNKVNYKEVARVRRVQKSWLKSTSELLRRNGDPLINLSTSVRNSRGEKRKVGDYEILNSFVSTFTQPDRIESDIPSISLCLVCAFFVPENHNGLSNFLVSCGPGVTSLDMTIPKNCALSFLLPRFTLPNLQQLSIKFVLHSHSDDDEDRFLRENFGVTYFIQQILKSSSNLEKLEFTASLLAESDVIPPGLDLLCLPKSVTTLLIKCPVLSKHLEIMVPRSSETIYSHLTKLEIMASEIPFPENTIERILVRHCATLKEIKLSGKEYQSVDVNRPSLFRMPPAMKILEEITLASPSWLCAYNFYMDSTNNYPNLTTFKMERVTLALFKKITDRHWVNLKSVKKLKVWLVSEQDVVNHFETTITLDLQSMQRLHSAFSCISNLDITICGKEICGLQYIFKEMIQLTSLAIDVENVQGNNMTCEAWDGLLIGVPQGIAKGLRKHTDFWDYVTLTANNNYPSIQKLTALSKLTLASSNMPIRYGILSGMRGRMISEVSFHYAFLKMPWLNNLHLFGRFQPSEVMINLWKQRKERASSLVFAEAR